MWSPDKYLLALRFAVERHQGQVMPGSGFPYVTHLAMVAGEVCCAVARESVSDPDLTVQCALLHDTLEDTQTSFAEVEQAFGSAVAAGVLALTKNGDLPKAERMGDSLRRIREQPREVWMVKLADRITNLQPPPASWTAEKRRAYLEEAREIHSALAAASNVLGDRLLLKLEYCAEHVST
jgi:(p)ppGpp synthase/HD superfamily hydrolase